MELAARALTELGHRCSTGTELLPLPTGEVVGVSRPAPTAGRTTPDRHDRTLVTDVDVLVLQPGPGQVLTPVIDGARRHGQVVVVDLDDWWWDLPEQYGPQAAGHAAVMGWLPELRRMLSSCDGVTVSTEFLRDRLLEWDAAAEVALVRNAIDAERWGPPEDVTDGPVLGYSGALSGHRGDVALLRGWLGTLVERHDLRVVHVGGHPELPDFAEVAGIDPGRVEVRPGLPWWSYATSRPMAGIDVGLVPLEDRPYSLAKSALKGMEYAACGIPAVASPTPEYLQFGVRTAGRSMAEQTPGAWVDAVESLLDPAVRTARAADQRRRLAAHGVTVRGPVWEAFYRRLLSRR
jgi:glycosyltransferase involved in cell wall biosynthesis